MDLTTGRHLVQRWRAAAGTAGTGSSGARPLSPAQQSIWLFEHVHPHTPVYTLCFAARHAGGLDADRLGAALAALVRRHPALRTTVDATVDGPVPRVHDDLPLVPEWTDLRGLPAGDRDAAARRVAEETAATSFDLSRGPLARVSVCRLADDDHLLVLAAHHLVCDGGSLRVLLAELDTAYRGGALPRPAPQPAPVPADDAALAYWRAQLADLPALDLPTDRPRPARPTFRAGSVPVAMPADLVAAAERLGRQEATTVFPVLLAAFQLVLGRQAGQADLAVGVPEAARSRPGQHGAVGLLANLLVLRADLSGSPTFRELVRRARDTCQAALAHRAAPFEHVAAAVEPARAVDRPPLIAASLVFHGETGQPQLAGSPLEPVAVRRQAIRLDVELHLWRDRGRLRGSWDYDADAVDEATATRLAGRLRTLLHAAVADPDRVADELDDDTEADRARLARWSVGPAPAGPASCLHQLVAEQAARTPGAVAVEDGHRRLTYRELVERSNRLAHDLRGRGVGTEDVVGVQVARSADLVVALLGVLTAGAAYLPLDPSYPAARLELMRRDCGARVVLDGADLADLDRWPATAVEGVDVRPQDLAYVLYTSGSTGRPKGVMITHRSAVGLVRWATRTYAGTPLSRVLAATSASFDMSVVEVFAPLSAGGTVVVVDDPLALLATDAPDVTLVNTVPSAAREILDAGALPRSVRVVTLGGEALPGALVDDLYATGRVQAVHNLYGPTEDTTYSTAARVEAGERPPPIGTPLPGRRGHVLDAALRPVPVGAVGELYLGGDGLARGYRRGPALTASRFVADPVSGTPGARLYRTGDLVRHRPDGALVFLGRRDLQVKVNGQRVELGEVDAALRGVAGVRDAAVAVHDGRLVGYVSPVDGDGPDPEEVRSALRRELPATLVPRSLVVLGDLPRTPNGKVDRRALPLPGAGPGRGAPPTGPHEELVAEVWREVLGLDAVSRDDDFVELGGHSLLAGRVLGRLRQRLGVAVPLRLVVERPVLAELAAALRPLAESRDGGGPDGPAPDAGPRRSGPGGTRLAAASPAQETLWLFAGLDPAAHRAYVMQGALRLTGPVRPPVLAAALHAVLLRHEALRTTLREVDGRLEQVVHPDPLTRLEEVELPDEAGLPALAEAAARGLDLVAGPLLRVHLAAVGDERHVLLLTVHHVVADGWSLATLGEELGLAYAALCDGRAPDLPDLPEQYADHAERQRRELADGTLGGAVEHWRTRLGDLPPQDLRTDRVHPPRPTYHGALVRRRVPAEVARRLHALGAEHAASPYTVLLAVLLVLLHRHSGQRDLAVGSPVAGRPRPELERVVGLFVTTVVLRSDVRDDEAFGDLLERVREVVLDALAHQEAPLEAVLAALRLRHDPSRHPLVQVVLNYLNQPPARFRAPGLVVEEVETPRPTAKFELELYAEDLPEGGTDLTLCYRTDLFEPDTAAAVLDRYVTLLHQVADRPEQLVGELRMGVPGGDRAAPAAAAGRRGPAVDATVTQRFAARVARHPDRTAVRTPDLVLTYADLDRRARALAAAVRERVPGPGGRVGVLCAQDAQVPVALLCALAAGHAYVPLDPSAPRGRLTELVELTDLDAVVADRAHHALATRVAGSRPVVDVTATSAQPVPAWPRTDPDAPAYVLFTSGSTGEPKAVVQSHRNLAHHVRAYLSELDVDATDRLSMLCPYTSDGAGQDLFSALTTGATACPADLRLDGAAAVREALSDAGTTVYHSTPTAFRHLAVATDVTPWPDTLHTVVLGGEQLSREDVALVRQHLPTCRVVNVYGLTECSIALMHAVEPGDPLPRGTVPVGHPVDGVLVELLDDTGRPAELLGEIACSSPALALGYLREEQTSVAFEDTGRGRRYRTGDLAQRLPDGSLEFLGRRDGQVKLRGHRVETGEVESRLRACPGVADAAVVPVTSPDGELRLAAYITGRAAPTDVRARLHGVLPHYMVPRVVTPLPALPTTRNGKIRRSALPEPDWAELTGSEPPRTPAEQVVADVVGAVLGVRDVGRQDTFVDLGGQSLEATRLVARLRDVLGADVSVRDVFELGTVERLAAALAPSRPALARRPPDAGTVLSFDQQRLWFENQLKPGAAYNVHGRWRLAGELDVDALQRGVRAVLARHEVVRARFPVVDGVPVVEVVDLDDLDDRLVTVADVSDRGDRAAREDAARDLADRHTTTAFDLARGPLFHCLLVRLGDAEHLLSITIHHIVADAGSVGLVLGELSALYEAGGDPDAADLPPLPVQYADYAAWQRQWLTRETLAEQVDYWRRHLDGAPPATALPAARRRSASQGAVGGRVQDRLSEAETAALRELCRRHGTTPFMTLLATLATVLSRWSGQDDLVVGVPVTTRDDDATSHLVGCFVNTLPLRVDLGGDPTFAELLGRVRQVALDGYARHGQVPLDVLVGELDVSRDPTRTPLFQVVLNVVDTTDHAWHLAGVRSEAVPTPVLPSKFDLTVNVRDARDTVDVEVLFHADRYDRALVAVLLGQLRTLLEAAADDPTRGVGHYALADPVPAPADPGPDPAPEPAPHAALARQAGRRADRVGVVDDAGAWTVGQLRDAADSVARVLAARPSATAGDPAGRLGVGIVQRRRAGLVAAVLGCARDGVPFVPVAPDQLAAAAAYVSLLLDPDPPGGAVDRPGVVDVGALLRDPAPGGQEPATGPDRCGPPLDWAVEQLALTDDDRLAVLSGSARLLASAAATAATAGSVLALAGEAAATETGTGAAWLGATAPTVLYTTPAVLRAVAAAQPVPHLPQLRYVIVESLGDWTAQDVDDARRIGPSCRVVGAYGLAPTGGPAAVHVAPEAGRDTWLADAEPLLMPLGTPAGGARVELLTGSGRPAATGEVGELCVAARHTGDLARRLPDGVLAPAGRVRAEVPPGAAEAAAALRDQPGVHDALVTDHVDQDGLAATVAYVACGEAAPAPGRLRQHLVDVLPEDQVPGRLVLLDRLPLGPDGDHDLAALPDPDADGIAADTYVAPRTPIERQLIAIFEELLEVRGVGVHDTFFELNGFSLLATQLVSRIRETFSLELSLREVFESPTVERLAQLVVRAQAERADAQAVAALLDEIE